MWYFVVGRCLTTMPWYLQGVLSHIGRSRGERDLVQCNIWHSTILVNMDLNGKGSSNWLWVYMGTDQFPFFLAD